MATAVARAEVIEKCIFVFRFGSFNRYTFRKCRVYDCLGVFEEMCDEFWGGRMAGFIYTIPTTMEQMDTKLRASCEWLCTELDTRDGYCQSLQVLLLLLWDT